MLETERHAVGRDSDSDSRDFLSNMCNMLHVVCVCVCVP